MKVGRCIYRPKEVGTGVQVDGGRSGNGEQRGVEILLGRRDWHHNLK